MDKNLTKLKAVLGARLRENEPLARYTTFKIGGPADYFYEAQTKDEFVTAVNLARGTGMPLSIIGGGTNLLIGDKGIRGIVIKNSSQNISIRGIRGSMEPGS
ncbi:FAD-binding protein, partial [Candidatus Gottesmanbacteria bacterium]|nr:FAD-binding protein [Candidatus Gottesmanbacteria bacterium]